MGRSTLVAKSRPHAALAEAGQRARMIEIRNRIDEARILDLCVAMVVSGRDLHFDQESMEIVGENFLDPKVRQSYAALLINKLIANAQAPKEIVPEDSHAKWADVIRAELEDGAGNDS